MYASNLLMPESITAVNNDLSQLNFAPTNQLADENLGLGDDTWACLSEMEEDFNLKPFFKAVRDFYIASLKKMLKSFHLGIRF